MDEDEAHHERMYAQEIVTDHNMLHRNKTFEQLNDIKLGILQNEEQHDNCEKTNFDNDKMIRKFYEQNIEMTEFIREMRGYKKPKIWKPDRVTFSKSLSENIT